MKITQEFEIPVWIQICESRFNIRTNFGAFIVELRDQFLITLNSAELVSEASNFSFDLQERGREFQRCELLFCFS